MAPTPATGPVEPAQSSDNLKPWWEGLKPQAGIEAMGVGPRVVRGELHTVAPEGSRPVDGGCHEDTADPLAAPVRMHMHRFNLGTQLALGLEVAEDDELAHADHLIPHLGHQDIARTLQDFARAAR